MKAITGYTIVDMGESYDITHIRGSSLYAPHKDSNPEGSIKEWGEVVTRSEVTIIKRLSFEEKVRTMWTKGEKIWFSWTLNSDNNRFVHEGRNYLRVDNSQVLAYSDQGEIFPAIDHFFSKEDEAYSEEKGIKKLESGLYTTQVAEEKYKKDLRYKEVVFYSQGLPIDAEQNPFEGLERGDKVLVGRAALNKIYIDGSQFYVGQSRDIMLKI